ncbi:MAG: hemerythrin domain-containing protein [Bacillota bacterium]|nr:hemerythrin domain-containing protein [Bacillota bacterium]
MSGPSLRKKKTHHSIHDGIYTEARDLTKLLRQLFKDNKTEHFEEVMDALVEHWEARTIAHAEAEEEGFFTEKLNEQPELNELIIKLKRDHQLLHIIVEKIKEKKTQQGLTDDILNHFETLLILFRIHNEEEEGSILFEHEH